ncbi:MAG: hypothetical protein ACE5GC_03340 [Acidimicrobiia bacterium]
MTELLLPRTDAGVLVQFVLVTVIFIATVFGNRRNRDVRILVVGLWVATYAAMGLRAVH